MVTSNYSKKPGCTGKRIPKQSFAVDISWLYSGKKTAVGVATSSAIFGSYDATQLPVPIQFSVQLPFKRNPTLCTGLYAYGIIATLFLYILLSLQFVTISVPQNIFNLWLGINIFDVLTSLLILHVSLCSVSDSSSQGFDPSEFPVLSLSSRARHDSSGGLITSSAFSQRPGYGMYVQHVQWTSLCALIRLSYAELFWTSYISWVEAVM